MAGLGGILWAIIVVLFVIWLIGFVAHVAGSFIHLLLVIAVILIIWNLIQGRSAVWDTSNVATSACSW